MVYGSRVFLGDGTELQCAWLHDHGPLYNGVSAARCPYRHVTAVIQNEFKIR